MAYTHINSYGSAYKRMKALSILGVPFGPDLPMPELDDGRCLFLHTDAQFDNGVWKWWDGVQWNQLNDPDRYGEATADPGTPNDFEVLFSPAMIAYKEGTILKVKFQSSNTDQAFLQPNSLPAREIVLAGGASLVGNEIKTGGVYLLFVTDNALQLLGGVGGGASIPDLAGNEGKVLSNDGVNLMWAAVSGGQAHTYTADPATSSSATIPDFEGIHLYNINPENLVATLSRKLPENPKNWDSVTIKFGGDITSGAVVTDFTLTADQDILLNPATSAIEAKAGDVFEFVFYGGVWYSLGGKSGGSGGGAPIDDITPALDKVYSSKKTQDNDDFLSGQISQIETDNIVLKIFKVSNYATP